MREVAPGDVVLSFSDTLIKALGIAASTAYEAPKPLEFGQAGAYWDKIGWRVDVHFHALRHTIRPSEHMALIAPLLPTRYAPLQPNGSGLQSVYLTLLPQGLAQALIDLIGEEARGMVQGHVAQEEPLVAPAEGLLQWEEHQISQLATDPTLFETDRQALVMARRGQGLFKRRVMAVERACRVTGVSREEHLRASHCKPWRDASNEERLDGENGLLLTPSIDHLFDRGFISFERDGQLVVSPVVHKDSIRRMGIDPDAPPNVGRFSQGQQQYLDFHIENVFLRSRYLEGR